MVRPLQMFHTHTDKVQLQWLTCPVDPRFILSKHTALTLCLMFTLVFSRYLLSWCTCFLPDYILAFRFISVLFFPQKIDSIFPSLCFLPVWQQVLWIWNCFGFTSPWRFTSTVLCFCSSEMHNIIQMSLQSLLQMLICSNLFLKWPVYQSQFPHT